MERKHFRSLGFRLLAIGQEVHVDGVDNREERQSACDEQPVNSEFTQRDLAFVLGHSSIAEALRLVHWLALFDVCIAITALVSVSKCHVFRGKGNSEISA